jgi:aconitate hydratase
MGQVEASLAGPKRPQDRVLLPDVSRKRSATSSACTSNRPSRKKVRLESEGGGGVAVGNAELAGEADYDFEGRLIA